jgi:cell division protein FtsB
MSPTRPDTNATVPPEGRGRVRRRLTAEEIRLRRRRILHWALSLLVGAVLVNALMGDSGYLATLGAAREEAAVRAELIRVRLENQQLRRERIRLDRDDAAVEEEGRRLGLIKDGEIVVTVRRPNTPSTPLAR